MKNNSWIVVIAIIAILGVGYLGRNQLKTVYGPQTTSTSADIVSTKTDPAKGNYLAAFNGMTLYIFDKDVQGVSNCSGNCLVVWPPYLASGTAPTTLPANVTAIKRVDGTMQYAWKGMPLYYYQNDKKVGDILGDGINGTWHLIKP